MRHSRQVGDRDELNHSNPVKLDVSIPLDLDQVVRAAIEANYGMHRLISAMIRQCIAFADKPENEGVFGESKRELAVKLEDLLNQGIY